MTTLTQQALDEVVKLSSEVPSYWFVKLEAETNTTATTVARVVNAPGAEIEYPTGSGDIWYPFEFKPPRLREDLDEIPQTEIVVSNVGGELIHYVDRAGGFVGRSVTAYLTSTATLSSTTHAMQVFTGRIIAPSATLEAISFTIGFSRLQEVAFPKRSIQRDRCDHVLGDGLCQFPFPTVGETGYGDPLVMQCTRILDGLGGCQAHGNNERDRGITVKHPLQFGGFPSVPLGDRR